eukprot:m.4658 g.4658  ORF g.4658 m.4658 type:complete len:187 (-) comp7098_c0_seq1:51-611(-)
MEVEIGVPSSYLPSDVKVIIGMVNAAYDYGEKGMWNEGFTRTTKEGVIELLDARKLLVAKQKDAIIGCIKLDPSYKTQRHNGTPAHMAEIGMLAVSSDLRRHGLGKKLMTAAIVAAQAAKCNGIELQLVQPKDWTHPVKAFLAQWYASLGFELVGEQDDVAEFFRIAQYLATEVKVAVYELMLDEV